MRKSLKNEGMRAQPVEILRSPVFKSMCGTWLALTRKSALDAIDWQASMLFGYDKPLYWPFWPDGMPKEHQAIWPDGGQIEIHVDLLDRAYGYQFEGGLHDDESFSWLDDVRQSAYQCPQIRSQWNHVPRLALWDLALRIAYEKSR